MKLRKQALFLLPLSILVANCSNETLDVEENIVTPQVEEEKRKEEKKDTKKVFYSIPSPLEILSLIKDTEVEFNETYVNSTDKASQYVDQIDLAVNLGVYGADLSYVSIYNNSEDMMAYIEACNNLSDKLNITAAFDETIFERAVANQNNSDSIIAIASEAFWNLDDYLHENGRHDISTAVIVGGWIEGLYIATQMAMNNPENTSLKDVIAEQKTSLTNTLRLLNDQEKSDVVNAFKIDLGEIAAIYENVIITRENTSTDKDEDGVMVLGGETIIDFSVETLTDLATKTAEIRTRYIK